ncbi:MAG: phosphodiesterase [Ruminococcaceae bacterium]|nr:phosphodiesterase [Oscillospiraceae bacterium]
MKLLICSDIHGDLDSAEKIIAAADKEAADKILILGDLLYHGPRNDLPKTYAPKEVIKLLNENKTRILAVRGNCDTEVDQMVLEFPILADYALLSLDGISVFATHGHNHNTEKLPPIGKGTVLLHGHTHVLKCEDFGDGNVYLNPGSAALPKEGNPRTYMTYENRTFTVKDFEENTIFIKKFDI